MKYATVLVALLFAASTGYGQLRTYHVGNSLTWDTQPKAYDDYAEQRSLTHEAGYHIRCGAPLDEIVANPGGTCVDPTDFGTWDTALTDHPCDVVTCQPHPAPAGASTLADDLQAALTLIDAARSNPANSNTRFILYGAWPRTPNDYADEWLAPAHMYQPDTVTAPSRSYQQALYYRIVKARPGVEMGLLSVGELLYMADQEIRSAVAGGGDWFGFTDVDQLYRDEQHLDYTSGRWLASLAMWSALTGEDPVGLTKPEGLFGSDADSPLVTDPAYRDGLAQFVSDSMDDIFSVPEPTTGLMTLPLAAAVLRRHRRHRS